MAFSRKSFLSSSVLAIGSLFIQKEKNNLSVELPKIKPKRLPKNATLGLIAPASPIYLDSDFDTMLSSLQKLGYTLKLGDHVDKKNGYLAGNDEQRVSDLHKMFADDTVDGILCIRGGYGSNRILDSIDYELIRQHPKPFIGFSDITSIHLAIQKNTGLITFHGPVGASDWNTFTTNAWNQILHDGIAPTLHVPNDQSDAFTIAQGSNRGVLLGGNLTVLSSLMGSKYTPDFDGAILFLEDVGESIYRIDRMMSQLALNGILNKINGFVFGKCTECSAPSHSLTLKEVFDHYIKPLGIPAFYGAMISHEEQNLTIPIGIQAEMNADNMTIKLLEPAVI